MPEPTLIEKILLIFLVIMVFNLIIFVHELGHFLAAKWRGLKIDRFQIWFGKPIWKKDINGVQYGLGWIPAGGFVALPQMAPMEAIEGNNREDEAPLPPIKPLDKIIVAFAGPLFSFLLALSAAITLWAIKKPADTLETTTIGWVEAGSKGADAGLQRGDRILKINGEPVDSWVGGLESVVFRIPTTRGDKIVFTVDRPGVGALDITSDFTIPPTNSFFERRKTRTVGIAPMYDGPVRVSGVSGKNSPAARAGLEEGDRVLSINGTEILYDLQVLEMLKANGAEPVTMRVEREDAAGNKTEQELTITPTKPVSGPPDTLDRYMIGAAFGIDAKEFKTERWIRVSPMQQVTDTLKQMWVTITSVVARDSDIGLEHLSGPIGIGKIQYFSLLMDHPFHRILAFMVLINVNLAILNMLPFPVLDGGHITFATLEAIFRRPVRARFLEVVQLAFVFLLFGVMLYVSSKDLFDDFGMGSGKREEVVFPADG